MNPKPTPRPSGKAERHSHEASAGEGRPARPRDQLAQGGGYRGGSRGAGTCGIGTRRPQPRNGPCAAVRP